MNDDFAVDIVFQIGDILEAPVAKRQDTNDQAIEFVTKLLNKHTAAELRQLVSQIDPGARPPKTEPLVLVAWKADQHWRKTLGNHADELDPSGEDR